jgi:nucleotide-binding universal stress UspA family protein
MILICYDGSADSQAAIDRAAKLFPGEAATVLCVWEPFIEMMTRTSFGISMFALDEADIAEIDAGNERAALERAQEGVELGARAGLKAQPRTLVRDGTIADAILAEAEAVGAKAIVLGTRGLTGMRHVFLGSVSQAVLQEADRPVIVVPSEEVAADRAARQR